MLLIQINKEMSGRKGQFKYIKIANSESKMEPNCVGVGQLVFLTRQEESLNFVPPCLVLRSASLQPIEISCSISYQIAVFQVSQSAILI